MWRPSTRTAGPLAVVGALCVLTAMMPGEVWPAPHPGDSYVFDPAPFSAIWAQRVVVPILTLGANVFILISLYALYRRDGTAMARWQRGSAQLTLLGTAAWLLGASIITSASPNDIIIGAFGSLVAVLALLITVLGLFVWGIGYLMTGQIRLGAALAGAPSLTILYLGVSLAGVDFDPVGGLLLAAPAAGMAMFVGYDLWVVAAPSQSGQRAEG